MSSVRFWGEMGRLGILSFKYNRTRPPSIGTRGFGDLATVFAVAIEVADIVVDLHKPTS